MQQKSQNFFETDAAAGITLAISAIIAILITNSPFAAIFNNFLLYEIPLRIGNWQYIADVKHWVKDGLMAIFFFHIGLEIKKEIMIGELSDPKKLALPVFGALGGMIFPAIIYIFVILVMGRHDLLNGWTIPVATDIAFAVAAISIVSNKVPLSLKIFLLTLAVVDDLGAVILIAALYSGEIDYTALFYAISIFISLIILCKIGINHPLTFIIGGILMWGFMVQSGFHPTLAGILTAITVPLKSKDGSRQPLDELYNRLDIWVKYLILPLFALTHAGFAISGMGAQQIFSPLVFAIICGLVLGKPIGVLSMVYLSKTIGIAKIADGINFRQLLGVGALCGIGFTMSLFIGGLSFGNNTAELGNELRIGIFTGSIMSGLLGIYLLSKSNKN